MKMINGRYKIIEQIGKNRTYSVYKAIDIKDLSLKVNIYILNSLLIENNILDFCISKFEKLSNNFSRDSIKILDFGVVKKGTDNDCDKEYFYVTEAIDNYKTIQEYVEGVDENELINIFKKICNVAYNQSCSYYRVLPFQIENLYISNSLDIKLKDEITNLLECNELGLSSENYKIQNDINSEFDDINETNNYIKNLLIILNTIALINKLKNTEMINYRKNIDNLIYNDEKKYKTLLGEKLYGLIDEINKKFKSGSYKEVIDILEDINNIYGTCYQYEGNNSLEVLNYNIPLVGREEEVKIINKHIDESYRYNKNVILLHGEIGIGKSRLIDHINYLLKNDNKYTSIVLRGIKDKRHRVLIDEIVKNIIRYGDQSLIGKYKKELATISAENCDEGLLNIEALGSQSRKDKLVSVIKLTTLLEEYFSNRNGVIIIDNIDKYDDYTFSIINYLLNRESITDKVTFLLTYRDGDCLNNLAFTNFLGNIKESIKYNMHLRPLPEDKCVQMLKCILNVHNISEEFSGIFYKYSMGNPLFIESALKELIRKKKIYADSKTGKWRRLDNPQIYMPSNMEEICKNQLKGIEGLAYKIIYNIAFFNMPTSIEILSEVLEEDIDVTNKVVGELLDKGILYSSISDSGFVYSFYNKLLRNFVYQQVEEEKRKEVHYKIYNILDKHFKLDKNTYIEEIIFHLEKLNLEDELIECYIFNEEKLKQLNSVKEAIKCCHKALNIIINSSNQDKYIHQEVDINIKLGDLYQNASDRRNSIKYLKNAEKLCMENDLLEKCCDVEEMIIWNYEETGNKTNVELYQQKMRDLLDKVDYKVGELKYLKICISNEYRLENYNRAKELSTKGIDLCGDEYLNYKVGFSNSYCNALIGENKIDEALEKLKLILIECENHNYIDASLRLYSSIGVLYCDFIQDGEKAKFWFEKQFKISKINERKPSNINSVTNIGFVNYMLLNYKEAYESFQEAYKLSLKEELFYDNFYNYTYMGTVFLKTGNYTEALKFASLCENFIKKHSIYGQEQLPYRIFLYYVYNLLGNEEEGLKALIEARKYYDETNSIMRHKVNLLYAINEVLLKKDRGKISNIIKCSKTILYIDLRFSMISKGIMSLIDREMYKEANELFLYVKTLRDDIKCDENKLLLNYFECILGKERPSEQLIESLELFSSVENPNILWRIYLEIGQGFYKSNDLASAAMYLSEACDIILDLLKQIPSAVKKQYIVANKLMINAYKILFEIKRYYNQGKERMASFNLCVDENIEELFQIIIDSDFINESFIKEVKEQKWPRLRNINTIEDLVNNLSDNNTDNLKLICKYIRYITLSTRVLILTENENKLSVTSSSDGDFTIPKDMSIINLSRSRATEIKMNRKVVSDGEGNCINYDNETNIKAAMCIPITPSPKPLAMGGRYNYNHHVAGYIYVEAASRVNNINDETMKKCTILGRIIYMIIDKLNIKYSSTIDKLTGALTRRYLELFIQEQIDRAVDLKSEFSIIMIDIDKFKDINDTYGHRRGDVVLQQLCKVALDNIRGYDAIGRYGGEEFIVILPNTNIDESYKIAERIRNKIAESRLMGDKRDVTISLGISSYPIHGSTYEELIEKADQALYAAKKSGRNKTKIWNESYASKVSTTNKLSGIFVGSGNQDYKNVSTVIEFIDMITEESSIEGKISETINKIAEITEADICTLFFVNGDMIYKKYSSTICKNENIDSEYSFDRVKAAIDAKENLCGIDWSTIDEQGENLIPELKSNMVVLLKNKNIVKGAIYLSVDINHKEFTYDELNFVNTLAKLMVPILEF